jgi:hypothetical protein
MHADLNLKLVRIIYTLTIDTVVKLMFVTGVTYIPTENGKLEYPCFLFVFLLSDYHVRCVYTRK